MKKRVYIFLSFLCICILLSGCKTTTPKQKQKAVEKYLKKYGAEVEYMDIFQLHSNAFAPMRDQNYAANVKVKGLDVRLVYVNHNVSTKEFTSNIQAIQFIPNVEQKLRELGPSELLQNCEFYIVSWAYDSQKIPAMSFEEYCTYDWAKDKVNPNKWIVNVFVWNLSDEDAKNYVTELKNNMKEAGINCTYRLCRTDLTRKKFCQQAEEKQPDKGNVSEIQDFQIIDFDKKKGLLDGQFLETIRWQYK